MSRGANAEAGILVVGESVLDVVTAADGTSSRHPGGSPANVAAGLARLGVPCTLLTELGPDAAGVAVRDHLTAAGVDVVAAPTSTTTPVARAHIGEGGAARYEFDISWNLDAAAALKAVRYVGAFQHVHTGSIATLMEPGASGVAALVDELRPRITVSFDPNVRPALIDDRARAVQSTEFLAARSDVIKASDEDLDWLYPGEKHADVAERWVRAGTSLVVVTRGRRGAAAYTLDGMVRLAPIPVPVVDTVGAGDACMSALIDGLLRLRALGRRAHAQPGAVPAELLLHTLERCMRASALTVARAGAQSPTAAELGD